MRICANNKIVDVQNDTTLGFVVYSNGKCLMKGSKTYEMAVAEFKRLAENEKYQTTAFLKPEDVKIGTKFMKRGVKFDTPCEVIDILKTYNSKQELFETQYLCQHVFMGQSITHRECVVTIQRGAL